MVNHIFLVVVAVFLLIHESLRATDKSQIKPIMKQRCGLNRNKLSVNMIFQGESASSRRALTAFALIALKEVQDREILVSIMYKSMY